MAADPSIPAAFIAGLLSFLSPCVLPLVSSWLIYLGGGEAGALEKKPEGADNSGGPPATEGAAVPPRRSHLLFSTASFILGFSVIFIILSLLFSGFFMLLGGVNSVINIIAGIIIILFGLNIIFNFIPFLNYEKRFHLKKKPQDFFGAFAVGLAFGAGWTPCIGPILGSILLMAGQSGELLFSAACLAAYSAGLGLPFLAAAFFWGWLLKYLARLRPLMPVIQKISGAFIIVIGVLMMLGRFRTLSGFFIRTGSSLAKLARGGTWTARFIPAAVFFIIALLPLTRKRRVFSWGIFVFSGLFAVLALLQAAGLIDILALLSRWFMYTGL
ncbi:MAG: cytochrome c biogenesis protein CcdA [Treponema sp.]|jgi:cytochrome c-type biogenesis protein|nr:cytochrome c biogenesis protein CcdA [Treponema sp.]